MFGLAWSSCALSVVLSVTPAFTSAMFLMSDLLCQADSAAQKVCREGSLMVCQCLCFVCRPSRS